MKSFLDNTTDIKSAINLVLPISLSAKKIADSGYIDEQYLRLKLPRCDTLSFRTRHTLAGRQQQMEQGRQYFWVKNLNVKKDTKKNVGGHRRKTAARPRG
jgi:hypothetical protein